MIIIVIVVFFLSFIIRFIRSPKSERSVNFLVDIFFGFMMSFSILVGSLCVFLIILLSPVTNGEIVKQDTTYLLPLPDQTYLMKNDKQIFYYDTTCKDIKFYSIESSKLVIFSGLTITHNVKHYITNKPFAVKYTINTKDSILQKNIWGSYKFDYIDTIFVDTNNLRKL